MGGAYGLDMTAALALAAGEGIPASVAAPLLAGVEAGIVTACRRSTSSG